MIKAGIVGGTGYTGVELLRLLAVHPAVELAVMAVQEGLSMVPVGTHGAVNSALKPLTGAMDIDAIDAIEDEVRHDVIAFLTYLSQHAGEAGRFIHQGMTSSDLLDTGLAAIGLSVVHYP